MHVFLFFLCYFCIVVVLRFFEYVPKSSFDLKLGGTYYEFTAQSTFTCSKLTIERLEQGLKFVQN